VGVTAFTFDRAHAQAFVRFGLERGSTIRGWIPPITAALHAQMAPEYPFYGGPGNHHRHFLCTAGGRLVGRVSAFVNAKLVDEGGAPIGAVGLFEAIEDESVSRELLDAATGWLASAHGIRRIWGPIDFDIWRGYRFMTRGFDQEPFFGEPTNPPWYPEHFARFGFTVLQTWATREVRGRDAIVGLARATEARVRAFEARGYRFRPLDRSRLSEELGVLHALTSASFEGFLGFTPIPREEFEGLFAISRHALVPELIPIVSAPGGEPVAFAAALPDIAPAVRAMRGSHGALARLRFRLMPPRMRRVVLFFGGMLPGDLRERAGLGRAGVHLVAKHAAALGCETLIVALAASGNASASLMGEHRHAVTREYALFELRP